MKIITIFPKDSEALFNRNSSRTFGGADIQMYLITRELAEYREISTGSFIIRYDTIDFDESARFNLIRTYREKDFFPIKFLCYHRHIRRIRPDYIIQRGLSMFSCLLALYCRMFSVRYVFMFAHDIESEGKYQKDHKRCLLFSLLLKNAHRLIVQNEIEFKNLERHEVGDRTRILKKGLDLGRIIREREKYHDCVWVGRCEEWKNPEAFIELAGKHRDLKFLMICSPVRNRTEFFMKIKSLAFELENLEFYEFLPNEKLYEYLAASRTFCITSDMEGDWPMTVLESAAAGLPILSLKLNYGNLFSRYDGGYFCENSFEKLSASLVEILGDPLVYSVKSDGALSYILENHEIKANVRKLLTFLED